MLIDKYTFLVSLSYDELNAVIAPPKPSPYAIIELLKLNPFPTTKPLRIKQSYAFQWQVLIEFPDTDLEKIETDFFWFTGDGYGAASASLPFTDINIWPNKFYRQIYSSGILFTLFFGPLIVAQKLLKRTHRELNVVYEASSTKVPQYLDNFLNSTETDAYFTEPTGNRFPFGRSAVLSRIFASYAREDRQIVEFVDSICRELGVADLRWDLKVLRSGDIWAEVLRQEIDDADSFQLFWSRFSSDSPNVENEWRYALTLERQGFIKPVFWSEPMPRPPQELSHLNFAKILVPN